MSVIFSAERAVDLGAEGRNFSPIGIAARLLRRRIGVGNILRDHPHAPGLGAQAGGGDGE
jgi:hypothetical protein